MTNSLQEITEKGKEVFRKYGVKTAHVFGSTARNELRADSDIDLLVTFQKPIDAWSFAGMADELEAVYERPVDLVTEKGVSQAFLNRVDKDLTEVYAE